MNRGNRRDLFVFFSKSFDLVALWAALVMIDVRGATSSGFARTVAESNDNQIITHALVRYSVASRILDIDIGPRDKFNGGTVRLLVARGANAIVGQRAVCRWMNNPPVRRLQVRRRARRGTAKKALRHGAYAKRNRKGARDTERKKDWGEPFARKMANSECECGGSSCAFLLGKVPINRSPPLALLKRYQLINRLRGPNEWLRK